MNTPTFLVAKKSFLEGMSRVLDLGSIQNKIAYDEILNSTEADYKALYSDWSIVGDDMRKVINEQKTKI